MAAAWAVAWAVALAVGIAFAEAAYPSAGNLVVAFPAFLVDSPAFLVGSPAYRSPACPACLAFLVGSPAAGILVAALLAAAWLFA